ncbi:hypothetical protein WCD74_01840 [Actinomycetospora sp. OC33-EN08]|uniref:TM2 domain-containing protein n=1 Tax=Actinomycetospora aurantiaca TaxID=3129233 RepID=A0ABU8MHR0_9PSEU
MSEHVGLTCPNCGGGLPIAGVPCQRCRAAGRPVQYPSGPQQVPPYSASFATTPPPAPYAPVPYPTYGAPVAAYVPVAYPVRPAKSAGVAVLLSFLWLGAGHLYLDRIGTGLTLMAAHFFVGFLLFFLFFPLGFLAWLAGFITCAIVCSNLANQINAGTVPPRVTW